MSRSGILALCRAERRAIKSMGSRRSLYINLGGTHRILIAALRCDVKLDSRIYVAGSQ